MPHERKKCGSIMNSDQRVKPGRAYLRVDELATRWGCSPRTVYNMIHWGELPASRIRGCLRILAADIYAYERKSRVKPTPE